MATKLKTCHPEAALREVADLAARFDVSAVPVVDNGGKLLGEITPRDLCAALSQSPSTLGALTAGDIMRTDEAVCAPDENVREVLVRMQREKVRQMPVRDADGVLRGMLSLSDLILYARHEAAGNEPSDFEVMRAMQAISARRCTTGHPCGCK
jgi:IMP dehydrogenase